MLCGQFLGEAGPAAVFVQRDVERLSDGIAEARADPAQGPGSWLESGQPPHVPAHGTDPQVKALIAAGARVHVEYQETARGEVEHRIPATPENR